MQRTLADWVRRVLWLIARRRANLLDAIKLRVNAHETAGTTTGLSTKNGAELAIKLLISEVACLEAIVPNSKDSRN
jgi:hypothetical protein